MSKFTALHIYAFIMHIYAFLDCTQLLAHFGSVICSY